MAEFRMPSLGADMEAGTLVEWRIKPGDRFKRGDVVAVVDTHKGAIEVEIWESGVVDRILVDIGQKVPVGTALALFRLEGEAAAVPAPAPAPPPPAPPKVAEPLPPLPLEAAQRPSTERIPRASPVARRMARELGLKLEELSGSGPGGAITRDDVERAAAKRPPVGDEAARRQAQMRQAIAAAMARSKREIPHYYLGIRIEVARLMDWLRAENERRPLAERMLYVAPVLKAVALALKEVPELNGFWTDGAFRPSPATHIGFAISLRGGGLVAPAIHDVDKKSPGELMRDLSDLIQRARSGGLRSSELSDPTVTVTSLGEQGVEAVFGIIYPPQVALVGLGAIVEMPWRSDGQIGLRPVLSASLAADHRASDGHRGGVFLAALSRLLQQPEKL